MQKDERAGPVPPDLDEVLAALDVGVLVQGPQGEVLYCSALAPRLLGRTRAQLLEQPALAALGEIVAADGTTLLGADHPVDRARRTGKPVRGAVVGLQRPDPAERSWLLVNAVPALSPQGEVERVLCSFTDITAQRRLEALLTTANASLEQQVQERTTALQTTVAQLTHREQLYRSVFDAMTEGIVVHDATGAIVDANLGATAVLGLSAAQLQGRTEMDPRWRLEEADGSDLDPETIPSRVSQRDGVPVRDRILAVHRPSGERALLSVNSEPVFGSPGDDAPTMVVATFEDITRRRQTQRALEESGDRLHRITDAVPGIVSEWSWQGGGAPTLTFLSGAGRQALGLGDEATLTAAALLDRIHPDDRAALRQAIRAAQQELTAIDLRLRLRTEAAPAAPRWFQLRATAERHPGGGRLYAILLDVDDQVRLAASIQESQKIEAIGELVAGVAHNFNNTLSVILPSLESLIGRLGAEDRRTLRDAITATHSASDLVRQLLLVARNEADTAHAVLDLAPIVRDAVSIARQTFDRGIHVSLHLPSPSRPCWVSGRTSHLQQVVLNLLINARDALAGEATPTIRVHLAPADTGGWAVSVADNGAGMDAATMARLGEPFFTTKPQGQGTGLGVATAVSIARDHGGTLTWQSAPGQGSTFTLCLPQHTPPTAAAPPPAPPAALVPPPAAPPPPEAAARKTVLLVDDEPLIRRVLTRLLHNRSIDVIEAATGLEGVERFAERHAELDAVLLDLSMPELSGDAALARLHHVDPTVPVIIMSGHVSHRLDLGPAFAVAQKPLASRELLALLQRAFAHRADAS